MLEKPLDGARWSLTLRTDSLRSSKITSVTTSSGIEKIKQLDTKPTSVNLNPLFF